MLSAPAAIPAMIADSFLAGFAPGRGDPARLPPDPLTDQLRQAGLLGQTHHRDQAGARHQILVIEHRVRTRPSIR
jgi:hypothetical protein